MTDITRLRMCGCGLAKYALLAVDGTWVFVCEDCDQVVPVAASKREDETDG